MQLYESVNKAYKANEEIMTLAKLNGCKSINIQDCFINVLLQTFGFKYNAANHVFFMFKPSMHILLEPIDYQALLYNINFEYKGHKNLFNRVDIFDTYTFVKDKLKGV